MGLFSAVPCFLYKPIAENNTAKIRSLLGLYQKLNRYIIVLVTVVGVAFIPFLRYIIISEPVPGLLIYYLVFLARLKTLAKPPASSSSFPPPR